MADETQKQTRGDLPPYVPFKTFRGFIEGLRANGVPDQIDRSVMPTYSGATQGQMMTALRYLGLIGKNGTPSPDLTTLAEAQGDERKKVLRDILVTRYTFLFGSGFNVSRATSAQLTSAFVATGAQGETVSKCVSFFLLAAKDAGLDLSPHFKHVRGPRSSTGARVRRSARRAPRGDENGEMGEDTTQPAARSRFEVLMEKFPAFDPSWAPEVQAKWFEAFERLQNLETESEAEAAT